MIVDDLKQAVAESRIQDGLNIIHAMISKKVAVQYDDFMPSFLLIVEGMDANKRRLSLNILKEMKKAEFLPEELETDAYNDLLASTAYYESTIDFALEITQEMEQRNLKPDIQATRTAFGGYYSGVS